MIDAAYFSRQIALSNMGRRGQERLAKARILVAGLGGTGTSASVLLALGGVGKLTLVDSDVVAVENLHRQMPYRREDVGKAKAEACASFIEERASGVKVRYAAERLDDTNATAFVNGSDAVVDCFDNLEGRYALNRACVERGVPLVHTGALGWEGSLAVFKTPQTACLECLLPPGHPDELVRCEEFGVLGTVTSVIGSMGALEAIKLASGIGSGLVGRILVTDFMSQQQRSAPIAKRETCSACGLGRGEVQGKRMIALCGAGEYYIPKAYPSTEFDGLAKSLSRSVRAKRMGDSVVIASVRDHDVALFRRGGVLIRGAASEEMARDVLAMLLRRKVWGHSTNQTWEKS